MEYKVKKTMRKRLLQREKQALQPKALFYLAVMKSELKPSHALHAMLLTATKERTQMSLVTQQVLL
jgi:hypothetical protein